MKKKLPLHMGAGSKMNSTDTPLRCSWSHGWPWPECLSPHAGSFGASAFGSFGMRTPPCCRDHLPFGCALSMDDGWTSIDELSFDKWSIWLLFCVCFSFFNGWWMNFWLQNISLLVPSQPTSWTMAPGSWWRVLGFEPWHGQNIKWCWPWIWA